MERKVAVSRSLPPNADLRFLKEEAKDLLKAHRGGQAACCQVLRLLRRFSSASDEEILAADVALHEAQFALALEYGFRSWQDLQSHVKVRQHVRRNIRLWERFGGADGWAGGEGNAEQVVSDPQWRRLVEFEIELGPLSAPAREIRRRIGCLERCHEHYVENVKSILEMIDSMRPGAIIDCTQASPERLELAAAYRRALEAYRDLDSPPPDSDGIAREVFSLLGPRSPEKLRLVGHLISKLANDRFAVYADQEEDFEKAESRIQHLAICNYNWRENLRIVLREIASGRHLFPWHSPDGYNAHGDCPDRIGQLREILQPVAAWADGRSDQACEMQRILGEATAEKRWLVGCLCKNVAAQHAQLTGGSLLAGPQL